MKSINEIFSYDNIVFTTYIAWSSILVIKMLLLSPMTAFQRMKTRVSCSIIHYSIVKVWAP